VALAVPFIVVAWPLGERVFQFGPMAAAVAAPAVFGLGLRIASMGMGQGAAKWLMACAMLACAGPLAVEYAAGETMNVGFPRVLELSPIVASVGLALEGWPETAWQVFAFLILWPVVGVILTALGLRSAIAALQIENRKSKIENV
jgi:hypothetical protein